MIISILKHGIRLRSGRLKDAPLVILLHDFLIFRMVGSIRFLVASAGYWVWGRSAWLQLKDKPMDLRRTARY